MGMAEVLARQFRQIATYWAVTSWNAYGDPVLAAPVRLAVRWENIAEMYIDNNGEEARGRAVIWSLTDFALGGYLYLGSSSSTTPESVAGADLIRSKEGIPDIKGEVTLYKAIL